MKKKTFYIETYGCQMNVSDSEIIASVLKSSDYERVPSPEEAELIFLNTCSIRENAENKIFNRLKHLRSIKNKNPNTVIGVLGCMAERYKEKLFDEQVVDIIAGPDAYRELPQMIDKVLEGEKAVNTLLSDYETYDDIEPVRIDNNGVTAFISIMRGCENFCAYCVVPFTRGKERSRNPQTILDEAHRLFAQGYREITLIGQNVNSYIFDNYSFPKLISAVAEISPLLRVRFATSHPKDLSDELIDVIAAYPNICKSIHLPVQSGSNRILELMNRKYTAEYYMKRVEAIYKKIPDCSISTDIITGFCTETEEDHQQTLKLMERVGFSAAFMFKYSERAGTLAASTLKDDIDENTKIRRLNEIIALQNQLSLQHNRRDIGKTFEVLIEGFSKRSPNQLSGRTTQNKVVVFTDKSHKPGDYVFVNITDCTSATLKGNVQDTL